MDFNLFIDESGDHGVEHIEPNYPIFILCGILIASKEYKIIEQNIKEFKIKYFNTDKVVLHLKNINRQDGTFKILSDQTIKKTFYEDLYLLLKRLKIKIFASCILKEKFSESFSNNISNLYPFTFGAMLEQVILYLIKNKNDKIHVFIESRSKKLDERLLDYYNNIFKNRSGLYSKHLEINNKISDINFKAKHNNIIGLQIADIIAYPIAKHVINKDAPSPLYDCIKEKICDIFIPHKPEKPLN